MEKGGTVSLLVGSQMAVGCVCRRLSRAGFVGAEGPWRAGFVWVGGMGLPVLCLRAALSHRGLREKCLEVKRSSFLQGRCILHCKPLHSKAETW